VDAEGATTIVLEADVKSCGPDTPTLVSTLRRRLRVAQGMVAKKPGAPGRTRISVKTAAQGMPDDRLNLWFCRVLFCCTRAMGEAFTRHSLRPLLFWRVNGSHNPGVTRRGNVGSCLTLFEKVNLVRDGEPGAHAMPRIAITSLSALPHSPKQAQAQLQTPLSSPRTRGPITTGFRY
jgi:hypothetical protein